MAGFDAYLNQQEEMGALPLMMWAAHRRRMGKPMVPRRRGQMQGADMFGHPVMGGMDPYDGMSGAAADDEEEALGAFDDELGAIDAEEDLSGRTQIQKLERKLAKYQRKRKKAVRKAQTGLFKRRWERRVDKLDDKISDVREEIAEEKKRVRALERGGEAPASADGVRPASASETRRYGQPGRRVESLPAQGQQVSIPILTQGGADTFDAAYAAGQAANSTVNIQGSTGLIPYASFRVVGLEVIAWVNPAYREDGSSVPTVVDYTSQVKLTAQTLQVDGGINLLYGNTTKSFSNPLAGSGQGREVITGLRQHDILDKNSIVQLVGFAENPFATTGTTGAFTATFTFNLLLEVLHDSKVR